MSGEPLRGEFPGREFLGFSIDAARRLLAKLLRDASIDSPELDARLLIGTVLDLDLTGLSTAQSRVINQQEAERLAAFAQRRIAGEPVARIVGTKEFWGLPFRLSAATLVPRPDTEIIVAAALTVIRTGPSRPTPRIADIGTGSGAILLALLSELPDASGVGTDIDEGALRTATENARHLGLAQRAAFVQCSHAEALRGPFDVIVSNPPYIPSHDIVSLDIEVRDHDPRRALDGGLDGLDAYRGIVPQAIGLLKTSGVLLVEVGQGQSRAVERLMRAEGITIHSTRTDLAGIPRVIIGQKWGQQGPSAYPEKHAPKITLGLDPRVGTGFVTRIRASYKIDAFSSD